MVNGPAEMYLHSLTMGTDMIQNLLTTAAGLIGKFRLAVDGGSGPGSYLTQLTSLLRPGGKLVAMDPYQEMLDSIQERFSPSQLRRVALVRARIEYMDQHVKHADLVLCASSLQFTEVPKAVDAVYKSLTDSGVFIFSMPLGLAGVLQEDPVGDYKVFQELFHEILKAEVAKHSPGYPEKDIATPRPDRTLVQFLNPCLERGFQVIGNPKDPLLFKTLQIIPASKLAIHMSVPWRAERLVPGVPHNIQETCISTAIKRTIEDMKLDKKFPFPRAVNYVALKKAVAGPRLSAG